MGKITVYFMGTGSAHPNKLRGAPSVVLNTDGELYMFDCGEGTQRQMAIAGLNIMKLRAIFLTHLHGDHVLGLPGLLNSMDLLNRLNGLTIFGPPGTASFIDGVNKSLHSTLKYALTISTTRNGEVYRGDNFRVLARRSLHSVPSYSYMFVEDDRPGRFHPEEAIRMSVPKGPLWGELQHGKSVSVGDRVIEPGGIVDSPVKGLRVGISGDTRPTASLVRFFHGADLLIYESTFSQELSDKAVESFHSTAEEAGALANAANVGHLILYHFSERYRRIDGLVREARRSFKRVSGARDLMSFIITNSSEQPDISISGPAGRT
ncbi:MAG: ribonuclease Z [Nitrososphaerota archaeon]|nr:ribonuclease Z [Nitrososphaerota archaeon]MDG7039730.1 ribonuclease Z [Nitrososphaerota archaeon]MDG7041458.1 ribonuclease Z [Nitrososphaerota archaeon]MDG7042791.1 ribonuclease Z [Nitrososphaerota archaeon]MDG7045344.1 ribonuclease Z [Nitrososphaerota archaeon]